VRSGTGSRAKVSAMATARGARQNIALHIYPTGIGTLSKNYRQNEGIPSEDHCLDRHPGKPGGGQTLQGAATEVAPFIRFCSYRSASASLSIFERRLADRGHIGDADAQERRKPRGTADW